MRYLFQGDSITDCGRAGYEDPQAMGSGFPRLLEAELTAGAEECVVMNCGISGSRVVDLLARWRKDCLNLKPDVLTILVGVNDVWHELLSGNGVEPGLFEKVYRILLEETAAALPGVRIILMGAYVTPGTSTREHWEMFESQVKLRRDITQKLAEEFGLEYIDLQEVFDRAGRELPPERWTVDGVHPTAAGDGLIAGAWKEQWKSGQPAQAHFQGAEI